MLKQFHYIDPNGKDQGINVRNRSAELVKLLGDVEQIRAERKKARANKNKYAGVEGGPGLSGFSSGAGRYGGFGSEQAGFGTYQGEVYGDGGGFGGRETDYSGTQRRGDQFEEYDAEEEGAARPSASRPTATAPAASAKRAPAKPKASEPDLFEFGDDEPASISAANGKAPATNVLDDFGPVQGGAAGADDDFDDFQSAASPSIAQPRANPLSAALSPPPPTTFTTTSAHAICSTETSSAGTSSQYQQLLCPDVGPFIYRISCAIIDDVASTSTSEHTPAASSDIIQANRSELLHVCECCHEQRSVRYFGLFIATSSLVKSQSRVIWFLNISSYTWKANSQTRCSWRR